MPKTKPAPATPKLTSEVRSRVGAAIRARRGVLPAAKPTKPGAANPCLCGCGELPSGKGRFKPGHDARLYSRILRWERGKQLAADPAITPEQQAWRESAHPAKAEPAKA